MDDFDRANRAVIRPHSGIAKHVADELGIDYQYFLNKWNPNNEGAKLTVHEWRKALNIAGEVGPIRVLAFEHGYELVAIDKPAPRLDLMNLHLEFTCELSEALQAAAEALRNGHIDLQESLIIEKEVLEAVEKANEFLVTLRAQRGK